ncbi:MAG: hypothetical protein ACXADY_26530 [Candidatus Hodarchaeales archaeon]|jgi:hypothetical protein
MTIPSTEDLVIIVNGNTITKLIPYKSVRIVNERGKRVSTCSFTIENGANLGLAQWQTVMIYDPDMTTVHFNGFLMEFNTKKRGVQIDYTCDCSSVEILLQNTYVNGDFTGTDGVILSSLLSNADVDLSDIFDWTSDVTSLLSTDIGLPLNDSTLLDALDALAGKAGADYTQNYKSGTRINIIRNPELKDNGNFYDGTLPTGSYDAGTTPGAAWNPANAVYNNAGGETDGGYVLTSQTITSNEYVYLRVGRTSESASLNMHIAKKDQQWLGVRFRAKYTGAMATLNIRIRATTYYEDGTVFHDGQNIGPSQSIVGSGTWHDWDRAIDLNTQYIPDSGWIELVLSAVDLGGNPFTLNVDKFLVEFLQGSTEPTPGSYFTGAFSDAYWLGSAHASGSQTGGNPLKWGAQDNAAFDIDIGNIDEIVGDLNINYNGFDGINGVLVTGGYDWVTVDWIYPANFELTHFDLETTVYPFATFSQPVVYTNIGTDESPNWSTKIVGTRQNGFTGGVNVLYEPEDHWLEFQDPPPDLKKAWRIEGRIKQRIRQIQLDEDSVDSTGQTFLGKLFLNEASGSEAFDIGQAELARRKPSATVEYTTYEPGLKAGTLQTIADDAQGFNETVTIERVTRTYLGGGYGKFRVEAGRYRTGLSDMMGQTFGVAETIVPNEGGVEPVTKQARILQDSTGADLTDANGLKLADSVEV